MAATDRLDAAALTQALGGDVRHLSFFAAMRRVEKGNRRLPRIGTSARVEEDPLRLGQVASLAFPPSELDSLREGRHAPRLLVHFLGLLGPQGPLPLHVTEQVYTSQRQRGDRTIGRFFDCFHHRMLSLFYRAWALSDRAVSHDRAEDDRFLTMLLALGGNPQHTGGAALDDDRLSAACGRLQSATRNAEGLAALIGADAGVPARVETFIGRWLEIPANEWCRLGPRDVSAQLGRGATLGPRQYTRQDAIRLVLGPMDLPQFEALLPGTKTFDRCCAWLRAYLPDPLRVEIRMVLRGSTVPGARLGGSRLGRNAWLAPDPLQGDRDDMHVEVLSHAPPWRERHPIAATPVASDAGAAPIVQGATQS